MADTKQALDKIAEFDRIAKERELTQWEKEERARMVRIARINELTALSRQRPLTLSEQTERARLRKEFLAEFRLAFAQQLDNTYVEYPDGSRVKLSERRGGK